MKKTRSKKKKQGGGKGGSKAASTSSAASKKDDATTTTHETRPSQGTQKTHEVDDSSTQQENEGEDAKPPSQEKKREEAKPDEKFTSASKKDHRVIYMNRDVNLKNVPTLIAGDTQKMSDFEHLEGDRPKKFNKLLPYNNIPLKECEPELSIVAFPSKPPVNRESKEKKDDTKKAKKEKERIRKHFDTSGFKVIAMLADGNCLFRALSHQLDGHQENHSMYRKMIVDFMVENPQKFKDFIIKPYEEYCKAMREDKAWGGEHELVAAAYIFDCRILVHQLDNNMEFYDVNPLANATRTLNLSYHRGSRHYNSLQATKEKCLETQPTEKDPTSSWQPKEETKKTLPSFDDKHHLEDLWKAAFPVGSEWDQLDTHHKFDWNFTNLEQALQKGGNLYGKKVYVFSCIEAQVVCGKKENKTIVALENRSEVWWDYENVPLPNDFVSPEAAYDRIVESLKEEGWSGPVHISLVLGYKCTHVPKGLNKKIDIHYGKEFSRPSKKTLKTKGDQSADTKIKLLVEQWLKDAPKPQNVVFITGDGGFQKEFELVKKAGHQTMCVYKKDSKSAKLRPAKEREWRSFMCLATEGLPSEVIRSQKDRIFDKIKKRRALKAARNADPEKRKRELVEREEKRKKKRDKLRKKNARRRKNKKRKNVLVPVVVCVESSIPPSDKIGVTSHQSKVEKIIPMEDMKMTWVPYIPLDKSDKQVDLDGISILHCRLGRSAFEHLEEYGVKKFNKCLPYINNPFMEELSTPVHLKFPSEPPVEREYDWEKNDHEEFTNDLINEEAVLQNKKNKFKFVKRQCAGAKKTYEEAKEALEETKEAYRKMRLHKFYPVPSPATPDLSGIVKTPFINKYFGNAHNVL